MTVSFVIVAYNEAQTLPRLLEDLCAQDYPHERIEVILIDSMSTDESRKIMDAFAKQKKGFSKILVLENTKKRLASGCNLAMKHYSADAIVRIDAHASIPEDFISKNVSMDDRYDAVSDTYYVIALIEMENNSSALVFKLGGDGFDEALYFN